MGLDIYAEELIYNYEHPVNKRVMENATISMKEENVSCGDVITVYLMMENGIVKDASFSGTGCVISMGTANILMNYLKGKKLEELERMNRQELLKLISIDPGPARMHCATLSLGAAKRAVLAHEHKPLDKETKEL